jgi:tRNA (Thr-GGU) A37 N-methylase
MVEYSAESKVNICSQCGKPAAADTTCIIDGKPVCTTCLYGNAEPFKIYPIGTVRDLEEPNMSLIELLPSQKQFMYKLEEEEYLTIVYYLHKVTDVSTVFKRGIKGDGKEVGVFASRTPRRPSRIAVQDVRLHGIKGTSLLVEGLDALEGSPVLDIKMGRNRPGYRVEEN